MCPVFFQRELFKSSVKSPRASEKHHACYQRLCRCWVFRCWRDGVLAGGGPDKMHTLTEPWISCVILVFSTGSSSLSGTSFIIPRTCLFVSVPHTSAAMDSSQIIQPLVQSGRRSDPTPSCCGTQLVLYNFQGLENFKIIPDSWSSLVGVGRNLGLILKVPTISYILL